jgi:hypothetical protein
MNSDDKNSDDKNSDDKNSNELSIDNTKISDEMWIKLFHIKLADLNRRVDEAKKNITNPKTPSKT